jgi:hypothetical protein
LIKDLARAAVLFGIGMIIYKAGEDHGRKEEYRPKRSFFSRVGPHVPGMVKEGPCKNYAQADSILEGMEQLIQRYGYVTAEYLDQCFGRKHSPRGRDVGWRDISSARVIYSVGGYMILLPDPEIIE